MVKIRQCELKDIDNVASLSEKVLKHLQQNGKSDLFGGVDETEIASAMEFDAVWSIPYQIFYPKCIFSFLC